MALPAIGAGLFAGFVIVFAIDSTASGVIILHIFDPKLWRHLGGGVQVFAIVGALWLIGAYAAAGLSAKNAIKISAAIAGGTGALLLYVLMTFFTLISAVI